MPNDAKLGLVLGMGLVVLITLVFFRKDPAAAQPLDPKTPGQVAAPKTNPPAAEAPASPQLPTDPPPTPPNPVLTDPLLDPAPPPLPGE